MSAMVWTLNRWETTDVLRLRELADAGFTATELASQLGRSGSSVRWKARRNRIRVRHAGDEGARRWLRAKLVNLRDRMTRLRRRVDTATQPDMARDAVQRLQQGNQTLQHLLAFARREGIAPRRYQRLLATIEDALRRIGARVRQYRSQQWKEVLTWLGPLLAVINELIRLFAMLLGA